MEKYDSPLDVLSLKMALMEYFPRSNLKTSLIALSKDQVSESESEPEFNC